MRKQTSKKSEKRKAQPEDKSTEDGKSICIIDDKLFVDNKPALPPSETSNCGSVERLSSFLGTNAKDIITQNPTKKLQSEQEESFENFTFTIFRRPKSNLETSTDAAPKPRVYVISVEEKERIIREIVSGLEQLETVKDFKTIGNFELFVKMHSQLFSSEEDLKKELKAIIIDYDNWERSLKKFKVIFGGIDDIYTNLELFKTVVINLITYFIKAMVQLESLKVKNQFEKICIDFFPEYLSRDHRYFFNTLLKNQLIFNSFLSQKEIEFCDNLGFSYEPLQKLKPRSSVFEYKTYKDFSDLMYSIGVIPIEFKFFSKETVIKYNILLISSQTVTLHYDCLKNNNYSLDLPNFSDVLIRHYELMLVHEYFHTTLKFWRKEILNEINNRFMAEVIIELRRFVFFQTYYDHFSNLNFLYSFSKEHYFFPEIFSVLSRLYSKGSLFLLALFDTVEHPENLSLTVEFCENKSISIRFQAFDKAIRNAFDTKMLKKRKIKKIRLKSIELYNQYKELSSEEKFNTYNPFIKACFKDQYIEGNNFGAQDLLCTGLLFIHIVLEVYTKKSYRELLFTQILKKYNIYKYLINYYPIEKKKKIINVIMEPTKLDKKSEIYDEEDGELTEQEFFQVMREEITELENSLKEFNIQELNDDINDYSEELDLAEKKNFDNIEIEKLRAWLKRLIQKRIDMGNLDEPRHISPEKEKEINDYCEQQKIKKMFEPSPSKYGWITADIYNPTPEELEGIIERILDDFRRKGFTEDEIKKLKDSMVIEDLV